MILSSDQTILLEQERVEALVQSRRKREAATPIHHAGDCVHCGEDIDTARRKAHPKAILCLPCETMREKTLANRRLFGPTC
jgi:RNA polymerase-binding transcription factor DksA